MFKTSPIKLWFVLGPLSIRILRLLESPIIGPKGP